MGGFAWGRGRAFICASIVNAEVLEDLSLRFRATRTELIYERRHGSGKWLCNSTRMIFNAETAEAKSAEEEGRAHLFYAVPYVFTALRQVSENDAESRVPKQIPRSG